MIKFTSSVSLVATVAAMLAATPALAQDEAAEQAADPEVITVTGRLRTERLQDVPLAITAITGGALTQQGVADIGGISKLVPSMVVGRQISGSGASIFLRGVGSSSLSSGFDQSVSVNIDGVPMARGREIVNTQYDLEQVEVLKGPQALFFGKNSTGGVVSITTANPTDHFEAKLRTGYEFVADEVYAEGVVSGPLSDTLRGRIAVRASKMQGYFKNVAQPNTLSGFLRDPVSDRLPYGDALSGRVTLVYDDADGFKVSLKATGTHMKDSGVAYERVCGGGRTTPIATFGIVDPYQDCKADGRISTASIPVEIARKMSFERDDGHLYSDHKSAVVVLKADKDLGNVSLSSLTSYYHFTQYDGNSFSGAAPGVYSGQEIKYDQFTQELRFFTNFDGPLNATAGALYSHGKSIFNNASRIFNDPVDPVTGRYETFDSRNGFTSNSYSGFLELNWKATPELEITGGARITHEDRQSYASNVYVNPAFTSLLPLKRLEDSYKETNVSPQATITWKPSEDLTLYAAYKEGFKTGGFNTSIFIQTTTVAADGHFGSEKARGGEIGLRSTLLDRALNLNLTAYNYDYHGLQVQVFNAVNGAQTVQNVGKLTVRGIEGELLFHVPGVKNLTFRGAAAYNDATLHNFLGACYTGQTIALGCNSTPNSAGVFQKQNLEGRTPPKAPKFAGQASVEYGVPVTDALDLKLSGGFQHSSSYNYTDALRPDGVQPAYTRWDAAARISNREQGWELALIGRNLTNKLVITSANDGSRQGSGSGTTVGSLPDLNAVVERGRHVYLEFSINF